MQRIEKIDLIGDQVAIKWDDGRESYFSMERLRALSPSAETQGEVDILGNKHGGTDQNEYPGVTVKNFEFVGSYAVRFIFSDGHNTGLYSYEYLKTIDAIQES